jgi:hypothetical protein
METAKNSGKEASTEAAPKEFIPQEDFLQSLYVVTQHWHSDVKFFEDELNFFRLLIDKHLSLLIDPKNVQQTRVMVSHVSNIEKERVLIEERISLHSQRIANLIENPFVQNVQGYREEHARLETDFSVFVKKFRSVKAEVFKLTERIIHSEKVKRLIDLG